APVEVLDHGTEAALLVGGPTQAIEKLVAAAPDVAKAAHRGLQPRRGCAAVYTWAAVPPFLYGRPAPVAKEDIGVVVVAAPKHIATLDRLPGRPDDLGFTGGAAELVLGVERHKDIGHRLATDDLRRWRSGRRERGCGGRRQGGGRRGCSGDRRSAGSGQGCCHEGGRCACGACVPDGRPYGRLSAIKP